MWWQLDARQDEAVLSGGKGECRVPSLAGRDRAGTLFAGEDALDSLYRIQARSAFPQDRPGPYSDQVLLALFQKAGVFQKLLGPNVEVLVGGKDREQAERAWVSVLEGIGVRKVRFLRRADLFAEDGKVLVIDVGLAFTEYTYYEHGRRMGFHQGPGLEQIDRLIGFMAGRQGRCLIHEVDVQALRKACTGAGALIWVNGMDRHGRMGQVAVEEASLRPLFENFVQEIASGTAGYPEAERIVLLGSCWLLEEALRQAAGIPLERREVHG